MPDTDIEDLIIDIAWRDYDTCFEDKKDLENKISIVLAADGILIGLITATNSIVNSTTILISTLLFLFSAIFCVFAIYLRDYKYMKPMKTWKELKERNLLNDIIQTKKNIFATIDAATEYNRENYEKIVFWTKLALISFIGALIVITISILINICYNLESIIVFDLPLLLPF
ncbi:MAG: hypothetical protein PWP08_1256 [Methanofollis sp.]|nr:hypothetical protein [Methanofollis sp.]